LIDKLESFRILDSNELISNLEIREFPHFIFISIFGRVWSGR